MASESGGFKNLAGRAFGFSIVLLGAACGGATFRTFPDQTPMSVDQDRRPFAGEPEEYYSPFAWDGANQTLFRPISQFFAVDPAGEAVNVNALDEVPDSSWFTNRIGRYAMTERQVARGPCVAEPANPDETWWVTGAKPNGANPGFLIKTASGQRYLLKFDGTVQGPRATAADVVGSRIYHAAGYFVPCNRIVTFDPSILQIAPGATSEDERGEDVPLVMATIDEVLAKGLRLPDGRMRANSSLFIHGKPIGPWTYEDTREDDPNDVIDHEDRRDVRAMRLLAAWTNHFDSREQNTLGAWIETGENVGYVRHYMIDFGDCFGSIWEPPLLGRRIGQSNYFDFHDVASDFVSFGVRERPWDRVRFGASGAVFGYYDVTNFDPETWQPGYPNSAFARMSRRDAAWMARIIARFGDAHVRAMVEQAEMGPALTDELTRILVGRRDEVLRHALTRVSPLTHPFLRQRSASPATTNAQPGPELCLDDLAVQAGLVLTRERRYAALAFDARGARLNLELGHVRGARVCQPLPLNAPDYVVMELQTRHASTAANERIHVHLRRRADAFAVVGLERPYDD